METVKKIFFPNRALLVMMTAGSAAGLGWVFLTGQEMHPLAYPIYVLSAYTLTALCLWLIPLVVKAVKRKKKAKLSPEEKNTGFRQSLKQGLAVNLSWALIQMVLGYADRSVWTGSQGAYTLVMAAIHIVLLRCDRKLASATDPVRKHHIGWQGFQVCGIWLFILHLTMTGQVFQMIWAGETEHDNEVVVIGVAAYTFYKLTMAIIRVVRYKQNASPLWGAARNIDLSEAIMNLYILQASLLAVFGRKDQAEFRFLMNTLVGGVVCLMTVGGSVGMVFHGKKRKNEGEGHG